MTQMRTLLSAAIAALAVSGVQPAAASDIMGLEKVELLPGWRMADGSHMAALHVVLEPGWKTYWRAPGDVGIPPQFDWSGSDNVRSVSTSWPTPEVFFEQGMRSVGYTRQVIIPIQMTSQQQGADIHLQGDMKIGVCKDICIPAHLTFEATLPPSNARPDPKIAAALTDRPFTAREAGVQSVDCRIEPGQDGELVLRTTITMPPSDGTEHVVVEASNPYVWVAEPDSARNGSELSATTRLVHVEGKSFALNRSDLRFTVIGSSHAVDIQGCGS